MKKIVLGVTLISAMITIPVFAKESIPDAFGCLKQMDKRVTGSPFGDGKALSLAACELEDEDMPAVASYLEKHPDIKYLDLDDNSSITSQGLATLFSKKPALYDLSLRGNWLGDEGAAEIAKVTTLQNLDTNYADIGAKGASALANLPHLTGLDLSHSYIQDEGAIALSKNKSLEFLSLSDCDIGPQGATALAQIPHLLDVDMSNNYIGDEGASALVKPYTYYYLDLSGNHITDKGASAYASNSDVGFLIMQHNDIGDEGAIALANNTNIQGIGGLDVSFNLIGTAGMTALENSENIAWIWDEGNLATPSTLKQKQPSAIFTKSMTASQKMRMKVFCAYKSTKACDLIKEKK